MIFDKLWQLELQRKHMVRSFKKDLHKAKTIEDRECIQQDEYEEVGMQDDEIQEEQTRRLLEQARMLNIPIPSDEGGWVRSNVTGRRYLHEKIRYELIQQIRKDKKEWREYRLGIWKDVLLLLTGIAAIFSSLWSIFRK